MNNPFPDNYEYIECNPDLGQSMSFEAEAYRLNNSLNGLINVWGDSYEDITFFLYSEKANGLTASQFWYIIRVMAMRFKEKHAEIMNNLTLDRRQEFSLILSELPHDIDMNWLGKVGFTNNVRLDNSLYDNRVELDIHNNTVREIKRIDIHKTDDINYNPMPNGGEAGV